MQSSSSSIKINKKYNFKCDCGRNFSHKSNFTAHRKKIHKDADLAPVTYKNCSMCEFKSKYSCDIIKHFETNHEIVVAQNKFEFASKEDFLTWKLKLEVETVSKYFVAGGSSVSKKKNYKTTTYTCHRSGSYVPSGKGIRQIKIQGTVKINAFCPASITLKEQTDGVCLVTHIATHVGHTSDIKHISLSVAERESIAKKISLKIPFDDILNDILGDSICDSKLERKHLLTRQDLYNIEASYNLSSKAVRHKDDATSVDAWIKAMQAEGNSVLFYKPQGTYVDEIPNFKLEDFILIIMTPAQMDILQQYGSDCVCLDGTYGLNAYNFELNTLLVLDELQEGFPCAFLISNRSDYEVLKLFFSQIKLRTGIIKPNVFMSDMADTFFKAWIHEMGVPNKRLYCTWHVDRSWKKNLSKIKDKETRAKIYKQLRTLLTERDVNAFHQILSEFCNIINPDSLKFIEYFKSYYVPKCEYWAYCYRLNAGINTNMNLERMHRSIKYVYLKGKNVKRLDKSISGILSFVRDKLIDKGKLCSKRTPLRNRHKNGHSIKNKEIDDRLLNRTVTEPMDEDMNNLIGKVSANNSSCKIILQDLSKKYPEQNFSERKAALISRYIDSVNSVTTIEELQYMEQHQLSINPTLLAMKDVNVKPVPLKPQCHISKNIIPQRKFFSTKKQEIIK